MLYPFAVKRNNLLAPLSSAEGEATEKAVAGKIKFVGMDATANNSKDVNIDDGDDEEVLTTLQPSAKTTRDSSGSTEVKLVGFDETKDSSKATKVKLVGETIDVANHTAGTFGMLVIVLVESSLGVVLW